jgi:DNA-binding MarR family transcriptional regulator
MKHDPSLTTFLPPGMHPALAASVVEPVRPGQPADGADRPGTEQVGTLRRTLLTLVRRDGRDLTARQLTAFMTVYLDAQVHTVTSMADLLNVSRPGVTRILDRLAEYELVARQEDHEDRRRVLIRRTARGAAFLRELEDIAASSGILGRG